MRQQVCDLAFNAIVAGLEPFPVRLLRQGTSGEPDIQRIASAVFCTTTIDPEVVAFAVRRTAVHRGRPEDEIDVAVCVALLASAARVMHDLTPLDAR